MDVRIVVYSKIFVLVLAGAVGAVFFEHIAMLNTVARALYSGLGAFRDNTNLSPADAASVAAVTRDVIAVGGVALLCLALCLALILFNAFNRNGDPDSILHGSVLPPRRRPQD
jgi:hypothetical protein